MDKPNIINSVPNHADAVGFVLVEDVATVQGNRHSRQTENSQMKNGKSAKYFTFSGNTINRY